MDKCDGCHVASDRWPFPHEPGCQYGTGDRARDAEIAWKAVDDAANTFPRHLPHAGGATMDDSAE